MRLFESTTIQDGSNARLSTIKKEIADYSRILDQHIKSLNKMRDEAKVEKSRIREDLENFLKECELKKISLTESISILEAKKTELENSTDEKNIQERRAAFIEKERLLEERANALDRFFAEVQERQSSLAETLKEQSETAESLEDRKNNLEALHQSLNARENSFLKEKSEHEKALSAAQKILKTKEEIVKQKEAEIQAKEAILLAKEAILLKKREEIEKESEMVLSQKASLKAAFDEARRKNLL